MNINECARIAAACCGMLLLAGCEQPPYKTVPVSGKVTYDDGTPIPAQRVRVQFVPLVAPVNAKQYPHPGNAELSPDGTFANVTTWKYADGVIPGPQKVIIQPLDNKEHLTAAVDPDYTTNKSPLTLEVTAGMPPVDLKVPKPKAVGKGS